MTIIHSPIICMICLATSSLKQTIDCTVKMLDDHRE
jgi:hypothetical protein